MQRLISTSILFVMACAFAFSGTADAQVGVTGGSGLIFSDKARTLGDGNFGVALFYQFDNYGDKFLDVDEKRFTGSVTVGIGDSIELSAAGANISLNPSGEDSISGIGDTRLKAKWAFLNSEKFGLRMSVIGIVNIGTGDKNKGLGTGTTDAGALIAIDKDYDLISWHFTGGYMGGSNAETSLDPRTIYSAGIELKPTSNLSIISEFSGTSWSSQQFRRDDQSIFTNGVRYYIGDYASVTAAYGSWGGGGYANYLYTVGVTVGLGLGQPGMVGAGAVTAEADSGVSVASSETGADSSGAGSDDGAQESMAADDGSTLVLESAHFKFDSSELTGKAKSILMKNISAIRQSGTKSFTIEGHTCSIGSEGYNKRLGLRRAESARKFLVSQGVAIEKMKIVSFGETKPAHTNKTREGRALNRRVDFVITVE